MTSAQHHMHQDWFRTQQQSWDHLFQFQQGQWKELLDRWRQKLGANDSGVDLFQSYFTQAGQQFLDLMQGLYKKSGEGGEMSAAVKDWAAGMQGFFAQLTQGFSGSSMHSSQSPFALWGDAMLKAGQAWTAPFHQDKAARPQGWNMDPFGFFAAMPGIGYTREKQEQWGTLYLLWQGYEQASHQYSLAMARIGFEAAQAFQAYIFHPPKDAPLLTSLKSVYVKWVDICEDVYGRYALTEEHSKLYGGTVNALMAYKKHLHALADDVVGEMNLPTRREVDSLHQRLHDVRRECLELRREIEALRSGEPLASDLSAAKTSKEKRKKS